jgi:hypothetical protein
MIDRREPFDWQLVSLCARGRRHRLCATPVQRNSGNAPTIRPDLPSRETADPVLPRSAAIGFHPSQLEGLAVARPWGFDPFRTNTK